MISAALLRRIMPASGVRAQEYAPLLEAARSRWVGDDWHHVAMWLAQIAHESAELRYVLELADGSAYEGRRDLGNLSPGDGPRYRGRGLLQITGRFNYKRCGEALGLPLEDLPELLERPQHAAASAGWVWSSFDLAGRMKAADPLRAVTLTLNGGLNGLDSRQRYYHAAIAALKANPTQAPDLPAAEAPPPLPPPVVSVEPRPAPAPAPGFPRGRGDDPLPTQTGHDRAHVDPPAWPFTPEQPMPVPPALAVGATLINKLIDVAGIFNSGSRSAERNMEAARVLGPALLEIAAQVVPSAVNAQQAAEQIIAEPKLAASYKASVGSRADELLPLWEQTEKTVAAARRADLDFAQSGARPWHSPSFLIAVLLLPLVYMTTSAVVYNLGGVQWSEETRAGVVFGINGMVIGAIVGYYFGMMTSRNRTGPTAAK